MLMISGLKVLHGKSLTDEVNMLQLLSEFICCLSL